MRAKPVGTERAICAPALPGCGAAPPPVRQASTFTLPRSISAERAVLGSVTRTA
jgi:hypothetical protein